jgi:pimeloyl-ACP methyl ester carboxylesterase
VYTANGRQRTGASIDHVIYVHGLWMNGADGLVLRRRLARDFGMKTHAFHYRSVTACMSDSAARLREYARKLGAERLHFVGHSLGGLVIYRMLEQGGADLPPGRVVFLGTPAVGSRAALGVRQRLGRMSAVMGRCVAEEFFGDYSRCWQLPDRPLGIVAGTHSLGMGGLFAKLDGDNDGTVAVSETRLPGASDFVSLPVSHMGLLLSARVARATGTFLQTGHFSLRP